MLNDLMAQQEEKVRVVRRSFDLGKITNIELQLVENEASDSREQLYATLFDHGATVAEFMVLHGVSLPLTDDCVTPAE